MKLNTIERLAMNNPVRAAHQHRREANWLRSLAGGDLSGQRVLEVGCGRGVGIEVLRQRLGAAEIAAFDLDPAMVDKAQRRVHGLPDVDVRVGDACEIEQPDASVDAVVEFGVIHHVPDWRRALAEIARVIRPGGMLLFEDIPRHTLDTWLMRTFTVHPRENRFEADEFGDALRAVGLNPGELRPRFGGHLFTGAARKEFGPTGPN